MTHRLMTLEACMRFGWPYQGIAQRLRRHPAECRQLTRHRQALDEVRVLGLPTVAVTAEEVSRAVDVSRQYGLLTNDALVVALMQTHQVSHLASHDADFDRVPGITRFAPS
jgi:predicted nucleic acid-binding protein